MNWLAGWEAMRSAKTLLLTESDWHEVCQRTARPIKVALLDQKLVAGIGNLYASEILHEARISPLRPASKVTREQARRLHAATQHILLDAIEHEGSTLGDGTYRNALNQSGGYQNAHRVYDRESETCLTCEPQPSHPHRAGPAVDVLLPPLPAVRRRGQGLGKPRYSCLNFHRCLCLSPPIHFAARSSPQICLFLTHNP